MAENVNAVHWFEIPATDISRATDFYEHVIGVSLKPLEQEPYKMAWFPRYDSRHGAAGALIQGQGRAPSPNGTLVYLTVLDIDAALSQVEPHGGKIVMPKMGGDFGSMAHIQDSEGNVVALFQAPPGTKWMPV